MRTLIFCIGIIALTTSCNNSSTAKTFCDTACNNDSIVFRGTHSAAPFVAIGVKNCKADSLLWTHHFTNGRLLSLPSFLAQDVSINKAAVDCFLKIRLMHGYSLTTVKQDVVIY